MPTILGASDHDTDTMAVTVPSGTEVVVAFFSSDQASNGGTLSTIALTGAGTFTIHQNVPSVSGSFERCGGVATATVSSTGAQTLSATWAFGTAQGPNFALVFLDDVAAVDFVRDSFGVNEASSTTPTGSVDSATSDTVLQYEARYSAPPGTPAGMTSIATGGYNSEHMRCCSVDSPGASSTAVTGNSSSWSVLAAISIKDVAGASSTASLSGKLQRSILLNGLVR